MVRLQLDQVRNVAEIRVNGHPLGVVWTAPWQADLSGFVRPGENVLEVDVTNLWVNRLIGDARLPAIAGGYGVGLRSKQACLRDPEGILGADPGS